MTNDQQALRAYAERLVRILASDLSRLADSGGVELSSAERLPLHVEQYDPRRERALQSGVDGGRVGGQRGDFQDNGVRIPVAEKTVLERWVSTSDRLRHPLIIVAPFGTGKSVMLASFATALAERLKVDVEKQPTERLLVPWPVRLRDYVEFLPEPGTPLPFLRFMYESQCLLNPNDDHGLIDWDLFEILHKRKLLVALFDGFDELPGDHDPESKVSRRRVLDAIESTCQDFYALTTRDGYEAEHRIEKEHQYVIREFTNSDVADFVERRFSHDELRKMAAKDAQVRFPRRVEAILRRPLFLAAWCELIPPDGSKPPDTIDEIMTHLVVRCFDKRRKVTMLSSSEIRDAIPRLGALLSAFAHLGFGNNIGFCALANALTGHPVLGDQRELGKTISIASAAGFLRPMTENSWYAYKIPVIEFMIGRYLADDARKNPDEPKVLIEFFRSWIWQMHLHDVLDWAFDALWCGTKRQQYWAVQLLEWTVESTSHELMLPHPARPVSPDDLLRPFAFAVLRWLSLNPSGAAEGRKHTRTLIGQCISHLSLDMVPDQQIERLFDGITFTGVQIRLVVESLIKRASDDVRSRQKVRQVVNRAARRIRECDAAGLVREWLAQHDHAEGDERYLLSAVIEGAAERIAESDARSLINELMLHYDDAKDSDQATHVLAIAGAANRLSESDALAAVKDWAAEHHRSTDDDRKSMLEWSIGSGLHSVAEAAIAPLVADLIQTFYEFSLDYSKEERTARIIEAAACRVSESDAANVLKDWIGWHDNAPDDKILAWKGAIESAAARLPESDADEVVRDIIAQHMKSVVKPGSPYRELLFGAAGRVSEPAADELIKEFMLLYEEAREDEKNVWKWAIAHTSERFSAPVAGTMIQDLIQVYRSIDDGGLGRRHERVGDHARLTKAAARALFERSAWLTGIAAAAFRLNESAADGIIQELVLLHNSAWSIERTSSYAAIVNAAGRLSAAAAATFIADLRLLRDKEKDEWQRAIVSAVRRLGASDALLFINEFIPKNNERLESVWNEAVGEAANRIDASDLLALCNALIRNGMFATAFQVARQTSHVAIISQPGDDMIGTALLKRANRGITFSALLRKDLVLDADLVAAPDDVRAVLTGDPALSGASEGAKAVDDVVPLRCKLKVDLARRIIYVNGRPSPQSSELACQIVERLIEARGGIVPSDQLLAKIGTMEPSERVKEAINKLTPDVRRFIKGRAGQGGGRYLVDVDFD